MNRSQHADADHHQPHMPPAQSGGGHEVEPGKQPDEVVPGQGDDVPERNPDEVSPDQGDFDEPNRSPIESPPQPAEPPSPD